MDAYFQGDMIVWSTQFNPGGIFYRKLHDRERRQSSSGLIVSDQNQRYMIPMSFDLLFCSDCL